MILSVSERTDICAFYSTWFYNRIKEGFVYVRNPFYPSQVSKIILTPEYIDAILFCTKNPIPMMKDLDLIKDFPYEFQITLTPYLKDIEPNVIAKGTLIKAIKKLSTLIGPERVIIRYDPILLNATYTIEKHIQLFEDLCSRLEGYTKKIIISFIDLKKNTIQNISTLKLIPIYDQDAYNIAKAFVSITKKYKMDILTCAEKYDFTSLGFLNEGCSSARSLFALTGKNKKYPINTKRKECHCLQTVDISAYNTCPHFCKYCYANYDEKKVKQNIELHDPLSPFLIGHEQVGDVIKERKK